MKDTKPSALRRFARFLKHPLEETYWHLSQTARLGKIWTQILLRYWQKTLPKVGSLVNLGSLGSLFLELICGSTTEQAKQSRAVFFLLLCSVQCT